MSTVTEYVRLRPHELTRLRRLLLDDPDSAADYAGDLRLGDLDEAVSSRGMDTDTAWAGLQYLLGKLDAPVDVIGGGEPITEEVWGFDIPRLLSAETVAQAARFLATVPFETLARHFDPAELNAAEIPPGLWDHDSGPARLQDCYTRLVAFFRAAAADGEPILIWKD